MITIGDESRVSIGVTLWGELCTANSYDEGQVIAFRACRVSDYNGKCLSASSDPEDVIFATSHPRFMELLRWQEEQSMTKIKSGARSLTVEGG